MLVRESCIFVRSPRNGASAQLHFCTWQSRSVCRPSSGRASSESLRDPSSSRTCVGMGSAERRPLSRRHGSLHTFAPHEMKQRSWWAIAATVDCRAPRSCCATHTNSATLSRSTPCSRRHRSNGRPGGSASSMLAVLSQLALGAADLPRKAVVESSSPLAR